MADGDSEATLLKRAQQGDSDALGSLLESYRLYLELIVRAGIGRQLQPRISASDVTQNAFCQAAEKFCDFRGSTEGEFVNWLRRIVARQVSMTLRYFRQGCRNTQLEFNTDDRPFSSRQCGAADLKCREPSPSTVAMLKEDAVLFAEAMAKLRPEFREVIVLRHIEALGFPVIAIRMGRTIDSVKNIWVRAVGQLQSELKKSL